jgi:putative redox protein
MEQRLTVRHTGKDGAMECTNPQGAVATFDGDGVKGLGPMEHLLAAVGACALVDVESILRKKRLAFRDLRVDCVGTRPDGVAPRPLLDVRLEFRVAGDVPAKAFDDAVRLSVEKYCSVGATVRAGAPVAFESHVDAA